MLRRYILRRFVYVFIVLIGVSIVAFALIQLPPGDYLTTYIMQLKEQGQDVDQATIAALEKQYGLDRPLHQQYLLWMWNMLHGDFGRSFEWQRPVAGLLLERLPLTIALSIATLFFTYLIAVPIGIYSATHQYSVMDFGFTVFGFAGLALPNFLFALILMWFLYATFGLSVGGLFSQEYLLA